MWGNFCNFVFNLLYYNQLNNIDMLSLGTFFTRRFLAPSTDRGMQDRRRISDQARLFQNIIS